MKTALLLIDIQKDYFPGGRMELVKPLDAAKKAYELLQCFREHHQQHVHIQHVALSPTATFFIPAPMAPTFTIPWRTSKASRWSSNIIPIRSAEQICSSC